MTEISNAELQNPSFTIRSQKELAKLRSKNRSKRLSKKLENRKSANYALLAMEFPDSTDIEVKQLIERSKGLVAFANKVNFTLNNFISTILNFVSKSQNCMIRNQKGHTQK